MWFGDFDLAEEETKPRGRALDYLRRLWPFFSPYRGRIVAAGILLLVASGLGLIGPILFRRAIDVNLSQGDLKGLALTSLGYLLTQVAIIFATYFQMVWLAYVGERGAANLKERLFAHILKLPMRFFDQMPSGKLISRVESDTEALKMLFTRTSVMMMQSLLMVVGMGVVMAVIDGRLFLLVAALLPPFVVAFWLFQKKVRPIYIGVRRTVADINNLILETLKGLPVVQVFCQEPRFAQKMDDLNRLKFQQELRAQWLWYLVWFLVDFGEVAGIVLVLSVGGVWALKGGLTIGTLVLFVSYISRLFAPVRAISDQINMLQRALASAERTIEILDQEVEPEGKVKDIRHLKEGLVFHEVSFAYDEEFVLKGVNLKIHKGEKVALVGETGGGKTSIVNLLLKFYAPQRGKITFDGIDLSEIDQQALRRSIGFVPQEVVVFPGTVMDNLRMFDDTIPAEQVKRAAARVGIDAVIKRFPDGYDTVLAEGGVNFSLGERQLLAFARALVRNPELLILDEATSSVDPQTEALIQEGLRELLAGRTAIIVAHRLVTVQMADRIVVVHRGQIAEEGRHEELLARGGVYSRLYRLQFVPEEG
ncbi:MAG: ABC transporter ATP-binding protein [candidate division WOR-3 bacterium]|jgi:ATP-binding cassette subfamily B protein|nr:ABC transporter ATP-binding protein/permease [candidate division WOR-3 bacterium]MDH7519047.1 ABC transporter ATP-binding protein [bacterium]